jgi:hypothetical protein
MFHFFPNRLRTYSGEPASGSSNRLRNLRPFDVPISHPALPPQIRLAVRLPLFPIFCHTPLDVESGILAHAEPLPIHPVGSALQGIWS